MLRALLAITCLAGIAGALPAAAASPEYSADAVETRPGFGNRAGRLYVRGLDRRFEHQVMGLPVIEIDLAEQGLRRIVYPLTRTYREQPLAATPDTTAAAMNAPCKETPQLACKRTGEAEIDGIKTEVWTLRPTGAPADSILFWDAKRRVSLREHHFDGRRLEATRVGTEKYEGRDVEHWSIAYIMATGARRVGAALVDPDLGTAIAERRPDGTSRHLVNIATGGVDADLFAVPNGYRRLPGEGEPAEGAAMTPAAPATASPAPVAPTIAPNLQPTPSPAPASPAPTSPAPGKAPSAAPAPAPLRLDTTPMPLLQQPETQVRTDDWTATTTPADPPPTAVAASEDAAVPVPTRKPVLAAFEMPMVPAPVRKPEYASLDLSTVSATAAASLSTVAALAAAAPTMPTPKRKPAAFASIVTGSTTAATGSGVPAASKAPARVQKPAPAAKPQPVRP